MTKQEGTKTMTQNGRVSYFYVTSGEGRGERVRLRDGSPVFPRSRAEEGAWACGDGGNLSGGEGRPRFCFFPEAAYDLGPGLGAWFPLVSLPGKKLVLQQRQQLLVYTWGADPQLGPLSSILGTFVLLVTA